MDDAIKMIHQKVENMRSARTERDRDADLVRMTRAGRIHELYPQHFVDDMPRSVVANTIDAIARDMAESIAPLPSLACTSGNMTSSADQMRAAKKNKIASYYLDKSNVKRQNVDFADSMGSYGFGAYIVEPDFEHKCPRIRWESSFGTYYYKDRFKRTHWYAKFSYVDMLTLCSKYPDHAQQIKGKKEVADNTQVTVVTYIDKDQHLVYLPDCGYLVLARAKNPLKRVPVAIAERPDQEDFPRGQFDDAVFPQLAGSIMAMYGLSAADKAINAPIAMPDDVTEMPYGPDATIRTQNPQAVQRVRLDVPKDMYILGEQLDKAVKEGSRYPDSRAGSPNANIITGKGVEALAGSMNNNVRTGQMVVGTALEEALSLCFEMDAALWPNMPKKIEGVWSGKPFELTYTPVKDIDSFGVKVTYAFSTGSTPAQAIVALLQLLGGGLVSQDTVRRNLPFDLDAEEEQRQIDIEALSGALRQGAAAYAGAMGPMIAQGQDPMQILKPLAKAIQLRRKGKAMDEALELAFVPPEPEVDESSVNVDESGVRSGPNGEQLPPGMKPDGLMQGVPPGQAGGAPGGMPAVQGLLARLRGQGGPIMEASVSRKKGIPGG